MSNPSLQPPGKPNARSPYLWQGERSGGGNVLGFLWQRSRQFFWAALLIAAIVLFAWLIWLLLLAPKRTPLVVLSAAPYSWPIPPNAWASEDFDKLAVMDGETITLRGHDEPVFKSTDFYERLDREIQQSQGKHHRAPLILWVSLHGVAEQSGHGIHLVPPNASPTDPESWIQFDKLIDRAETLGADRNVLLILDCNRMLTNWNIGLLANAFSNRVKATFDNKEAGEDGSNADGKYCLTVMLSAGMEEQSHVSAELGGSVFGHFMQLGLSGVADRPGEGGNGDGWVDVTELHRYLKTKVRTWTVHSRGQAQTPILLSTVPELGFRLARSLNSEQLDQLTSRQIARPPSPTLSGPRLDALWRSLDEMRSQDLYRREPIAFRSLEHDLLWLEQMSTAGDGYRTVAQRTLEKVQSDVKAIEHRISQLSQRPTVSGSYALISGNQLDLPRSLRVHSLPMAEFFGTQPIASTTLMRDRLAELSNQPTAEVLARTKSELEKQSNSEYASTQFIRMLDRYQSPRLWRGHDLVGGLLQLQTVLHDSAVPRDLAGLPADLRVHRWNRALLSHVDPMRRDAEDCVFLRDQAGLAEKLAEANRLHQSSIDASTIADQTMKICDLAMATTPYYAQWIADPRRVTDVEATKADIDNVILPLITESMQLASQLADVPGAVAGMQSLVDRIHSDRKFASDRIEPLLKSLEDQLSVAKRQLIIQSDSNRLDAIGEIQSLLSVPLVDWQSRRDLRNALAMLTARIQQNLDPTNHVDEIVVEESQSSYAAKIASWKQHPLEMLLQGDSDSAGQAESNRIAVFLESVHGQLEGRKSDPTLDGQRKICSDAARRIRSAAAIGFRRPDPDAIAELRTIDIESLLFWHCQRALDDCWGPAGGERSFYELAATDYCDSVAEMNRWQVDQTADDGALVDVRDARSLIASRQRFLSDWLTTTSDRTIQLDPDDAVASVFTVNVGSADGFVPPEGTAAIVVRSETRRVDLELVKPSDAVRLPTRDANYEVVLPADVARFGLPLKAQTIFRGHEYGGSLGLEQLGGVTIDVHRQQATKSEVTLSGPWDELSVVFVLDCSASMNESLAGGDEDGQSRIEIAKSALQEMLLSLGLRRNVRVGIRAFGHRLGWSVDEPVTALTRPDFSGQIDPTLTPDRDVESVLTLGEFDLATAQAMVPEIAGLKPWGQSPLYLSVLQSIQEFSVEDSKADRHVIVITDGANYQFIPPSANAQPPTTSEDVRHAWASNQVPVHILGLGMDRDRQRDAVQEFDQLSRATGGRFQALGRSTDLGKALRNLLAPGMYRLLSYQDKDRPEVSITLGAATQVMPVPSTPELFAVQYEGRQWVDPDAGSSDPATLAIEPIVLEGGEAYQLYVNEPGTEIYDYPFSDNVVAMAELVTPDGAATDHVVRIHRPDRQPPERVIFPVSWQRRDSDSDPEDSLWRATRRPEAVWIQIQPIGSDGNRMGQAYTFFDANYDLNEPVPVMSLVASGWPTRASRARVRLWSRPSEESTFIELLPPSIEQSGQASSDKLDLLVDLRQISAGPVEVAEGIAIRMDPLGDRFVDGVVRRRYVVEFSDAAVPVTSIKLDFSKSFEGKPMRVIRQFDQEHHMSVHTFYYASRTDESPAEIRMTNFENEVDGAWTLMEDSIEVEIPDSGGLLPVGRD